MSWSERKDWLQSFVAVHGLGNWFDDMISAIEFMIGNPSLSKTDGVTYAMDAGVLFSLSYGYSHKGQSNVGNGAQGWANFFKEFRAGNTDPNHLIATRLSAEQQGVNWAYNQDFTQAAYNRSSQFDRGFFDLFKLGADSYRGAAIEFRSNPLAVSIAEVNSPRNPAYRVILQATDPRTSGPYLVLAGEVAWREYQRAYGQ